MLISPILSRFSWDTRPPSKIISLQFWRYSNLLGAVQVSCDHISAPPRPPPPLRQWSTWGIIFRGKMGYVRGTLRYGYIGHSRPESSFVGNFAFTIWSGQIYYCAPILLQWIPISHVTKSVTTRIRLDMVRLLVTTNFCVQQLDPIIWDSVQ